MLVSTLPCIIITKSPTKGGKIGPDYECTIDRFTGGKYYYDGGCGGMTFEFSITCNKEDGGCSFTEVSVSRLSTASSYILVMLMLISIFIPDYISLIYYFPSHNIHISLVLAYSFQPEHLNLNY